MKYKVLIDPRYEIAGRLLSIDRSEVLGRIIRTWLHCVEEQRSILSEKELIATFGIEGCCDALTDANLISALEDGRYYIRGTDGEIEWLGKLRSGKSAGGSARARSSMRDANGVFMTSSDPALRPAQSSALTLTTTTKDHMSKIQQAYREHYPRKEGVTKGMQIAEATIHSDDDCEKLIDAIKHYGKLNHGKETKYIKLFSTFMGCWTEYIPIATPSKPPSLNEYLIAQEARVANEDRVGAAELFRMLGKGVIAPPPGIGAPRGQNSPTGGVS